MRDWRILERFSANLFLISRPQDSHVRYAPVYIHRFPLCAPRKLLEATGFNRQYQRYEQIRTVPDRLRWLRHSWGLMQKEVAAKIGMSHHVYKAIEEGTTRQISTEMRDRLARFYDVANEDLIDAFNRFLLDGQANRIRAIRSKTGLSQREFARQKGIPVQSLEAWENEKRAVTYKSWEKYFKGRA